MTRLLGLDIGGSTTRARLVADGEVVAEVSAGSASMTAAGPAQAVSALAGLLAQLPRLTGSLDAVCAGAAGAITAQQTRSFLHAKLAPLTTSGRVVVVDDASLILPAAGLTDGLAIISGTGSIATGSWRGRAERAGGWGYLLGDEGSGYWVVRAAIRALLVRQAHGQPAGPLGDCLLAAASAETLAALRAEFYRQPAPRHWARHAPAVLDCGDPEADRIASAAARALSDLAALVAERLMAPAGMPVVLAGGALRNERLLAATRLALAERLPASPVQVLSEPPVAGAVRLAAAAAAGPPQD